MPPFSDAIVTDDLRREGEDLVQRRLCVSHRRPNCTGDAKSRT